MKLLLDEKYRLYAQPCFLDTDPISVPHRFSRKEDIEIAGFLAATIAWGQRKSIIDNANRLMALMDNAPYDFLVNHQPVDCRPFRTFVHRTFNGTDCSYFLLALSEIYRHHGGLETLFTEGFRNGNTIKSSITGFRDKFLSFYPEERTKKHIANPDKGSTAKRLNMFLRWMVRGSQEGVDFGLWKAIPVSGLMMPIDLHSGYIARQLGLLERRQNDWLAVEELTRNLRQFDQEDPVKYDFALFGMGALEGKRGSIG